MFWIPHVLQLVMTREALCIYSDLKKTYSWKRIQNRLKASAIPAAALTEALRLKKVGLLHTDVATPGQEVGGVVTSEEGSWRGVPLTCHLPRGEQLSGKVYLLSFIYCQVYSDGKQEVH